MKYPTTVYLPTLKEDPDFPKRVSENRGWCRITELSGDYDEELYMATFTDDFRIIFECNGLVLSLLLTRSQKDVWNLEHNAEQRRNTLEEVAYYFLTGSFEKIDG